MSNIEFSTKHKLYKQQVLSTLVDVKSVPIDEWGWGIGCQRKDWFNSITAWTRMEMPELIRAPEDPHSAETCMKCCYQVSSGSNPAKGIR